jgi:hypothetical protein
MSKPGRTPPLSEPAAHRPDVGWRDPAELAAVHAHRQQPVAAQRPPHRLGSRPGRHDPDGDARALQRSGHGGQVLAILEVQVVVAAWLATFHGRRHGSGVSMVPRRSRLVLWAMAASRVQASTP